MNSRFIFVACQNGAESICKSEILANHSGLKLAFSRPGFLTFKVENDELVEKFVLKSTFARTYGWSVSSLKSAEFKTQTEHLLRFDSEIRAASQLHLWQRDTRLPGSGGFEPGGSVLTTDLSEKLSAQFKAALNIDLPSNRIARSDQRVLDVILVEPDYWFIGFHFANTRFQRWPGGTPLTDTNKTDVISRAYYKLRESLLWSGIHIQPGDVCAEIGSSPGGACQLLLEKGAKVFAIDPADIDPSIAEHPSLTHLKRRGKEVRKKELKDVRWLLSDINVAPNYTLDAIEEIITNQHINKIQGLILTLKLSDLQLGQQAPEWICRVRNLGFQIVKTRQLAFNRKEICLVAVRDQFALRSSRRTTKNKRSDKAVDRANQRGEVHS